MSQEAKVINLSKKMQGRLIEALKIEYEKDSQKSKKTGRGASLRSGNERESDIRVYDFEKPDKFSKSQFQTLGVLFENFAREASTYLAATTHVPCEVEIVNTSQKTFKSVLDAMTPPTLINIFSMSPLEGQALLEISIEVAFAIIEKVFGGKESQSKLRELTEIEREVTSTVVKKFLRLFSTSWEAIRRFDVSLDSMETNPQFVQIAPAMEICVVASFSVRIGRNRNGVMVIALPFMMLESVVSKLNAHLWFQNKKSVDAEKNRSKILSKLKDMLVNVKVELGKSVMSLSDIEEMQEGDIVLLNKRQSEKLSVFVENEKAFSGKAYVKDRKKALLVEDVAQEQESLRQKIIDDIMHADREGGM